MNQSTKALFLMVTCTVLASTAQILLKFGANKIDYSQLSTIINWSLFFGMSGFALGAILMMTAFRLGELSVLLPILSLSYVWISLFSPLFFVDDSMNLWKWLGVMIIVFSVGLLGFVSKNREMNMEKMPSG